MEKLRCQRIGCNAMFTEDDNPEGSCTYHDSIVLNHASVPHPFVTLYRCYICETDITSCCATLRQTKGPIFHDGMKEWSCCKKKSHDFSLFLELPGCKTGKHTTEKPVPTKVAASPKKPTPVPSSATNASSKEACSRCHQGFFCSDHGSQSIEINPKLSNAVAITPAESNTTLQKGLSAPAKKMVDINQPQICKNKGCGQTFKEKDNHDAACNYHPGPAVFHDRMRGWKCCDIHVKEFDEFMTIPPCTRGWHNADPVS